MEGQKHLRKEGSANKIAKPNYALRKLGYLCWISQTLAVPYVVHDQLGNNHPYAVATAGMVAVVSLVIPLKKLRRNGEEYRRSKRTS